MTAPEQPAAGLPVVAAADAATATTGGGVTFNFVFNNVTYTVQVYAPDAATGQYGFKITQAGNTIASLIYKDDADWEIGVGLPDAFKVDDNLTINKLEVNIAHGSVQPLT
jgi:hypothetical protein